MYMYIVTNDEYCKLLSDFSILYFSPNFYIHRVHYRPSKLPVFFTCKSEIHCIAFNSPLLRSLFLFQLVLSLPAFIYHFCFAFHGCNQVANVNCRM